jgi:hypothetical protein
MPYVQVDGIHDATGRARRLGAAVAVEPREGPVSAQATVQDHEHYSRPIADDLTACGFSLHVEGIVSGNARNRWARATSTARISGWTTTSTR